MRVYLRRETVQDKIESRNEMAVAALSVRFAVVVCCCCCVVVVLSYNLIIIILHPSGVSMYLGCISVGYLYLRCIS